MITPWPKPGSEPLLQNTEATNLSTASVIEIAAQRNDRKNHLIFNEKHDNYDNKNIQVQYRYNKETRFQGVEKAF